MWVGQAGGFGGGRGLHSHTDGSRVPELSHSDLLSSQGDASKRSGRLDPTLLNRRVRPRLILVPVLASALATPEAPVAYPGRPDLPEVSCVATVHDDFGLPHEGSGALEVEGTDLLPLGDHYRRVRSGERLVEVKDDLHLRLGHHLRHGLARYGIVAHHPCIQRVQGSGYLHARGLPKVVCVGLESEAQQHYALPL